MSPFWWVQAPISLTTTASSLLIKHLAHSTSHRDFLKISESLEPARLGVEMLVSLWNLTGASAAVITFCTERHYNKWDGVSNHRRLDGLLNRWFNSRSRKTSKLRITGLCEGNPPVSDGFPSQRVSNAENVSIRWRHHDSGLSCHVQNVVAISLPRFKTQWNELSIKLNCRWNLFSETGLCQI